MEGDLRQSRFKTENLPRESGLPRACATLSGPYRVLNPTATSRSEQSFRKHNMVQVGIHSPSGVTATRGVLRRFNDFLKLFSDLKKEFPKKNLPSAPPKGLLRMKSRALLEERRCSLEEWISKLLSDIDISRSVAVASFLELEAAARFSFLEANQRPSEGDTSTNSSISLHKIHSSSSYPYLTGSSSLTSDYGSDTAYETSELGSPILGMDDSSEVGLDGLTLDENLANPLEHLAKYSMSNIDEGLLMGESILDQLECFKKHKGHSGQMTDNGSTSVPSALDSTGSLFDGELSRIVSHIRKPSNDSIGSDLSSYRGSEMSNSSAPNLRDETSLDLPSGAEISGAMGSADSSEAHILSNGPIVLSKSEQPKLNRILMVMQRRLVTAKTDMEDLITRLNQEVAVKEYLTSKVKDLEVELETTKEKYKENLQQALSLEKERITKMQWAMEELRRKSLEMELKLKSQEDAKLPSESTTTFPEKDGLLQELADTKNQLNILLKQHEELEVKSKSDIKILVKEVKSLRKNRMELKEKLDVSLQERSEMEQLLQQELQRNEYALAAQRKLLRDCQTFQSRLQECNIKFVDNNFATNSSLTADVFDLLAESDRQIGLLLAESTLSVSCAYPTTNILQSWDVIPEVSPTSAVDEIKILDHSLRLVFREIFYDYAKLRKQVTSLIRPSLQRASSTSGEGEASQSTETYRLNLRELFWMKSNKLTEGGICIVEDFVLFILQIRVSNTLAPKLPIVKVKVYLLVIGQGNI
ncbi:hypothetical protein Cgig2_031347 [Carnegiea gigantea]|uniref:PX domain-containing protein n=1 Tax=Carnegiea gigantea TaxID=171969 RepID=A0A9Q1GJV9_9CARY|nr:hypothetical protein Cgig2_031347 [Carnegiea gigantea]